MKLTNNSVPPARSCLVVSGWLGRSRLSEFRPDDDGRADFVLRLIDLLRESGIDVTTDAGRFTRECPPCLELHIEAQISRFAAARQYLLLIEDRHIRPQNYFTRWSKYRRIFTWDDDIVERYGAEKYLFPSNIQPGPVGDFHERNIFMSMVAANKSQAVATHSDLYVERARVLRWYQRHAPFDLQLFGPGWDLPIHPPGMIAKLGFKILRKLRVFNGRTRPCWRGIAPVKRSVLLQSKFNLCYENTSGARGYISEKIFDALSTGSVPIYWGAPNVTDYIPASCFIDRRRFSSNEEMHEFLSTMPSSRHREYQVAMHNFCMDHATQFSVERFAIAIASGLLGDLQEGD